MNGSINGVMLEDGPVVRSPEFPCASVRSIPATGPSIIGHRYDGAWHFVYVHPNGHNTDHHAEPGMGPKTALAELIDKATDYAATVR